MSRLSSNYFERISDYMNDPILPPNKLNIFIWLYAFYHCLTEQNKKLYR